jgi:hypothetical protein
VLVEVRRQAMSEIKAGDKVRAIADRDEKSNYLYKKVYPKKGTVGVVIKIDYTKEYVTVDWPTDSTESDRGDTWSTYIWAIEKVEDGEVETPVPHAPIEKHLDDLREAINLTCSAASEIFELLERKQETPKPPERRRLTIEEFRDEKIAIHCETLTEAFLLIGWIRKCGADSTPIDSTKWDELGAKTCYSLGNIGWAYGRKPYYTDNNYTVIPYADIVAPRMRRVE